MKVLLIAGSDHTTTVWPYLKVLNDPDNWVSGFYKNNAWITSDLKELLINKKSFQAVNSWGPYKSNLSED